VIPRRKLPLYGLVLAYGISQLGTLMSGLAIPWLVLVTTGSAARTGLVGFAEMAPYVVAQAISGPVVDRFGLRRSCVTGNAAAAVLVGAIPALYAAGALSIGSLFAIVAVAGAVRGAADAATSPLVPRAAAYGGVPNERAAGLNSVAQRTGMLAGLPLAGVLIAAAGAPTVVLVDAVTFAVAALLVATAVPSAATKADAGAAAAVDEQWLLRMYEGTGGLPRIAHVSMEFDSHLALVRAGLGIALVPRLGRSPLGEDLAAVEVANPVPSREILALHRASMSDSPAIAALLTALDARRGSPL